MLQHHPGGIDRQQQAVLIHVAILWGSADFQPALHEGAGVGVGLEHHGARGYRGLGVPAFLAPGSKVQAYVAPDIGQRGQRTQHLAIDIEEDDNLVRVTAHRVQHVAGLGHGVGFPAAVLFRDFHEVMRFPEAVQVGFQPLGP